MGSPHSLKLKNWNLTIRWILVSDLGHSLGRGSYRSAEVKLAYFTAPTNMFIPLSQSGPGSNDNGWVLHILLKLKNWNLTIRCILVSDPGHSLENGSYTSAEVQLVYSTISADKVDVHLTYFMKNDDVSLGM